MRLIDVDELPVVNTIEHIEDKDVFVASWIPANLIDKAPTVNAIPVEWIKKYIEDHTYEMVNPKYVDDTYNYVKFTEEPLDYCLTVMPIQVKAMLADWERENETN